MRTLFGNFDPATQSSVYDVPQTTIVDLGGFERGDEIRLRTWMVLQATEAGVPKTILLTYAIPLRDQTFDCHACRPLIGAAVFEKSDHEWKVENSRTVASVAGSFGQPPEFARIVNIGPKKIAIEITDGDEGQGQTTTVKTLLVPWEGKVNETIERVIADDNKGSECGDPNTLPCYEYHRQMKFVPGTNAEYYDVVVDLSGTDITDSEPFRLVKVNATERLEFKTGKYVRLFKKGDTTSLERFVNELRRPGS